MCCAALGFAMKDLAQHIGLRPTSHTPGTLYAIAKEYKNEKNNTNYISKYNAS